MHPCEGAGGETPETAHDALKLMQGIGRGGGARHMSSMEKGRSLLGGGAPHSIRVPAKNVKAAVSARTGWNGWEPYCEDSVLKRMTAKVC